MNYVFTSAVLVANQGDRGQLINAGTMIALHTSDHTTSIPRRMTSGEASNGTIPICDTTKRVYVC